MIRDIDELEGMHIIKTLMYFDIFNYPLNRQEIFEYCFEPIEDINDLDDLLTTLVSRGMLYQHGEFYSIKDDPELVTRRLKGNEEAQKKIKLARRISKLIYSFPFVRGVMLSGSISKNYMDEGSDIDYFIVTAPGRLWVSRMLMVMFKRIFFFNSHKFFCVNYFVDYDHLEIEEKNRFTAIETVTLMPTVGTTLYTYFRYANEWSKTYFPNFPSRNKSEIQNPGSGPIKCLSEFLLKGWLGEALDKYFMKLTLRRWNDKFKGTLEEKDFEIAFKTRRHTSKNHPKFYQKRLLDELDRKMENFKSEHLTEVM